MNRKMAKLQEQLAKLPIRFQIVGTEQFDQNGIHKEIIILEYENDQFVLVEGGQNITLGWDSEQCPLGTNVLAEFKRDYEAGLAYYQSEYDEIKADYEAIIKEAKSAEEKDNLRLDMEAELEYSKEHIETPWEAYRKQLYLHIKECTSPLRTVDIPTMIVERDSRYLTDDLSYSKFKSLHGEIAALPFTIPTEDEWEYLCSGGTRTFFRWGDSLDINAIYDQKKNSFYSYNMNGLHIAYNPYRFELIANATYVKGGDGGGSMCGGEGPLYVASCFSSFYRDKIHSYDDMLSKDFYTYRRILRLTDL